MSESKEGSDRRTAESNARDRRTVILLQLRAPMMSFGGPVVDSVGRTYRIPKLSMITGLIGNALGIDKSEFGRLEALQRQVEYGIRVDSEGEVVRDFQIADLGQEKMLSANAWTTKGRTQPRTGSVKEGKVIQRKKYLADAQYTVAVYLRQEGSTARSRATGEKAEERWEEEREAEDGGEEHNGFTTEEVEEALQYPARTLYIGRKTCIPSAPIYGGSIQAKSVESALAADGSYDGWVPMSPEDFEDPSVEMLRMDGRKDWRNNTHTGAQHLKRVRL